MYINTVNLHIACRQWVQRLHCNVDTLNGACTVYIQSNICVYLYSVAFLYLFHESTSDNCVITSSCRNAILLWVINTWSFRPFALRLSSCCLFGLRQLSTVESAADVLSLGSLHLSPACLRTPSMKQWCDRL